VFPIQLTDDLTLAIGKSRVTLTPSEGLQFSEELARKSFRRALTEEAGFADTPPPRGKRNAQAGRA
jgi:hypothetical protein